MIVSLIPFFLGAYFQTPLSISWNHKTEVTYLVDYVAKSRGDSSLVNLDLNLRAMLTCQNHNFSLFCHFHDVYIDTYDVQRPVERVHRTKDSWTSRTLQEVAFEIAYDGYGKARIWFPEKVQSRLYDMARALARLLIVNVNFSKRITGKFGTPASFANNNCETHFEVGQTGPVQKPMSSTRELFLMDNVNYPFEPPLYIKQEVKQSRCVDKSSWYSFLIARESVDAPGIQTVLNSAENIIVIDYQHFSSFSKIITTVSLPGNIEYIIDEKINLTLQEISSPNYPYCNDKKSHFHVSSSYENKKYLLGQMDI